MQKLLLTGSNLTIGGIGVFVEDTSTQVEIDELSLARVDSSRSFLDEKLDQEIIYGVNTGFGPMATHILSREDVVSLQANLVRSHAVGMGAPIPDAYTTAIMVVRLNTLAKGFSGVSRELLDVLSLFLNRRIVPLVPLHGAVGASGDLVQLAHLALAIMGEGEVNYRCARYSSANVLKLIGVGPYKLRPKEGLALINGTSGMSGVAALLCLRAHRLLSLSIQMASMAYELVGGFEDAVSERFHQFRPHAGQGIVAQAMRQILLSSRLIRDRTQTYKDRSDGPHSFSLPIQQVYSLRCVPQILGPVFDSLAKTWNDVEIEINSVSDNPIVDFEKGVFLHGGHFHGDYIASSIDQLKIGLVKLTLLSERRANFFLNHNINKQFPPFLNLGTLGLNLGLQGLQFVITSTAAQNQTLAFPHSIHSISTNGDNQDVVSMGLDAALMAMTVIDNAYVILAGEIITLTQAADYSKNHADLSHSSQDLYSKIREVFPVVECDRVMIHELPKVVKVLESIAPLDLPFPSRCVGNDSK